MKRPVLRLLIGLVLLGSTVAGCANDGVPTAKWDSEPDVDVVDEAIGTQAVQRLAQPFLRSQQGANAGGAESLRRVGAPVMVYATNPRFRDDVAPTLDSAGTASYIAVPVRIAGRAGTDTVQLASAPPYRPQAMATGDEETGGPRGDARLLLDYPTHTWFAWTRTSVTVLSSGANPGLAGTEFDAAGFRVWLGAR